MKHRFCAGLLTGLLIGLLLAGGVVALGDLPIKLIINGQIINCKDTPPQIINGRTYVPVRYVAEPLGATVTWDEAQRAVVITGQVVGGSPTDIPPITTKSGEKPAPRPDYTKPISVGELADLGSAKIKVTGITYSTTNETLIANKDEVFALINMEVFINEPPKNALAWSANNFISQVKTSTGLNLGQIFCTGSSMRIPDGQQQNVTAAVAINATDRIKSITIQNPITNSTQVINN